MISVGAVRTTALVVCVLGIAGMILTSILNHNGAAVTFGLVTAVAVLCSMVAKAVAADAEHRLVGPAVSTGDSDMGGAIVAPDTLAALVESQIQAVVAIGADETAVRQLVGEAVRLGRNLEASRPATGGSH